MMMMMTNRIEIISLLAQRLSHSLPSNNAHNIFLVITVRLIKIIKLAKHTLFPLEHDYPKGRKANAYFRTKTKIKTNKMNSTRQADNKTYISNLIRCLLLHGFRVKINIHRKIIGLIRISIGEKKNNTTNMKRWPIDHLLCVATTTSSHVAIVLQLYAFFAERKLSICVSYCVSDYRSTDLSFILSAFHPIFIHFTHWLTDVVSFGWTKFHKHWHFAHISIDWGCCTAIALLCDQFF